MAESGEAPVKRGRGRPKGSLNRKTIERLANSPQRSGAEQVSVPFALDVDFESNEILGEEAAAPQQSGGVEGGVDERFALGAALLPHERVALGQPRCQETPTPKPERAKPKRVRSVRIAAPAQPPATVVLPSYDAPNYLELLRQGLSAAKAQQKAERVARYDAFFTRYRSLSA